MKYKTKSDFVTLANERLIATLSRNLADMEQGGRRDAVSVCPAPSATLPRPPSEKRQNRR